MIKGCNCLSCIIEKEQLIEAMRKDGIIETEYCNCDACKFRRENYEMNVEDYRKGFSDGMGVNTAMPLTFSFMGYNLKELTEIIYKHNEKRNSDREKFRKALNEAGFAGFTTYSSPILEAYDKIHCPELRK